jgi:hypothetical protein
MSAASPGGDEPAAAFRARFREIESRIGTAGSAAEREAVKRDIIALFKSVDASLGELGRIKEEIRGLVDRYKQAAAAGQAAHPPEFTGARPAVHQDHIGASTFIEKGWSLISLGDYPGAIQALTRALALSPGAVEAQSLLGPDVVVVDSASTVAADVRTFLASRDLVRDPQPGRVKLLATDLPRSFAEVATRFLGEEAHEVEQVDL